MLLLPNVLHALHLPGIGILLPWHSNLMLKNVYVRTHTHAHTQIYKVPKINLVQCDFLLCEMRPPFQQHKYFEQRGYD